MLTRSAIWLLTNSFNENVWLTFFSPHHVFPNFVSILKMFMRALSVQRKFVQTIIYHSKSKIFALTQTKILFSRCALTALSLLLLQREGEPGWVALLLLCLLLLLLLRGGARLGCFGIPSCDSFTIPLTLIIMSSLSSSWSWFFTQPVRGLQLFGWGRAHPLYWACQVWLLALSSFTSQTFNSTAPSSSSSWTGWSQKMWRYQHLRCSDPEEGTLSTPS